MTACPQRQSCNPPTFWLYCEGEEERVGGQGTGEGKTKQRGRKEKEKVLTSCSAVPSAMRLYLDPLNASATVACPALPLPSHALALRNIITFVAELITTASTKMTTFSKQPPPNQDENNSTTTTWPHKWYWQNDTSPCLCFFDSPQLLCGIHKHCLINNDMAAIMQCMGIGVVLLCDCIFY